MGNSTLSLGGGDPRRISEVITQSGHTFGVGDVVRADDVTPAKYVLAQANTAANAEAVGIIETVAGDSFELVYQGRVDLSGVSWTDLPFAATSEVWFLSPTIAGELTRTPPNTAGTVIKAMLVVTDDTGGAEEGVLTGYVGVQIGGESSVNLNDIQPVGTILAWAAPSAAVVPSGWQLCNGDSLVRVDFPELFSVINVDYGLGDDDPNTFNVPDLRGRVGVGLDGITAGVLTGNNNAGDTGGEEEHILDQFEIPDHPIELGVNFVTFSAGVNPALVPLGSFGAGFDGPQGFTPIVPDTSPGLPPGTPIPGGPHNTMQPFLVINYLIRVTAQSSIALLDHDLSQHDDVGDVSTPNNCDVLKFNEVTQQWEAGSAPGSGPAGTAVFSFRNQIINGQFDLWQRGPGPFTAPADLYTADRWLYTAANGGGVPTVSVQQRTFTLGQTEVPGFPRRYMDIQHFVTGGDGTELTTLVQRIESVRTFNDTQLTVSFWAMTDVVTPGQDKIAVFLRQFFGSGGGGSATVDIAGQEITLTTTWTYYTLTFTVLPIAGKSLGSANDDSLRVLFALQAGATAAATAGLPNSLDFRDTLSLANVQIEEGSSATAFEIRELETEIALCQRYFAKNQDLDTVPSIVEGPSTILFSAAFLADNATLFYPNRMRAAPTLLFFNTGVTGAFISILGAGSGESSVQLRYSGAPGAGWTFNYTADAEL